MKLKKRIQYFFFPNNRIRDKINSLYHEAIVIMADNDPVSSTPSATRVALDKIQRIEKEIKKLELTYKYKGTGNRILLWLWGNYWVCLGVSFYCLYFTFSWGYVINIVLNTAILWAYGRWMLKNQKKREDLFIEGI